MFLYLPAENGRFLYLCARASALSTMRRLMSRSLTSAGRRACPSATSASRMSSGSKTTTAARRIHATARHLQPSLATTATSYPTSHDKIQKIEDTLLFIDNKFVASATTEFIDLHDPATNNLVTRVPQSTDAELRAAVESAERAFPGWRATSVLARQQIMFQFVGLIRENWDRLAASITLEQGKTFADAKGDVPPRPAGGRGCLRRARAAQGRGARGGQGHGDQDVPRGRWASLLPSALSVGAVFYFPLARG